MASENYVGSELELFREARHWKRYFADSIRPQIRGRVAEVGAGIGATLEALHHPGVAEWLAIEPDPEQSERVREVIRGNRSYENVKVLTGTLTDLPSDARFDTILYVDVLEHIREDRAELERASRMLSSGGRLIVLSPAHQYLYSEFDRSIGHFRRYNRATLRELTPPGIRPKRFYYLDSVGFAASLANRLLLRQSLPTSGQIALWDRVMVPLSRLLDPLLFGSFGKTVIGVWEKP